MRDVLLQIAGFVVGAGLLGLLTGWTVGRASARRARRAAKAAEAEWLARDPEVVVHERVLVRPDPLLYAENERLRDRLVVLQARVAALTAQVAELEARAVADRAEVVDLEGATRSLSLVTEGRESALDDRERSDESAGPAQPGDYRAAEPLREHG